MSFDVASSRLWQQAEEMDRTLRITPRHFESLHRKFVRPTTFSRHSMFLNMARREVSIFRGVPVLVHGDKASNTRDTLIAALSKKFPPRENSRVQVGPSHHSTNLPVREIMRRWLRGRAIVGVTDLHIRGTKVEDVIDTAALSDFNVIICGSDDLAREEMMTLVIASPGNVTDSHSDDPSGTNHCFFGKKLWLAWDTFEGMPSGLQDVERQSVPGQAKFDMSRFLALQSSRWFLVSTGDTLFLPGNLTHKVVTLEPYLGVGSFYLGLPSSLDSLTRWIYHGPLWSILDPKKENAGLVDEAAKVVLRVARRAHFGPMKLKDRWGYHYMYAAYAAWKKSANPETRRCALEHPTFRSIVEIAKSSGAGSQKGSPQAA